MLLWVSLIASGAHTSGFNCHTLAADVIEGETMYIVDVAQGLQQLSVASERLR